MKLTVIGYWGAFPKRNEATSCYLLQDGEKNILLDCGSGAVSQLQNVLELWEIDAIILTHYHHDHLADMGVLTYSRMVHLDLQKTTKPLMIYGHKDDAAAFEKLGRDSVAIAKAYTEEESITIGSLTFSFQKTSHSAPCYAIRCSNRADNSIVYTGDTTYDERLIPFVNNTDLLITEASFYEHQDAKAFGHMNSKEAATLAEKGNVKSLLLSHLPHFGDHSQLLIEGKKYFSREIHLAKSMMTIQI